jgi:hypothetical protein
MVSENLVLTSTSVALASKQHHNNTTAISSPLAQYFRSYLPGLLAGMSRPVAKKAAAKGEYIETVSAPQEVREGLSSCI